MRHSTSQGMAQNLSLSHYLFFFLFCLGHCLHVSCSFKSKTLELYLSRQHSKVNFLMHLINGREPEVGAIANGR